jgi:hypothetical protein
MDYIERHANDRTEDSVLFTNRGRAQLVGWAIQYHYDGGSTYHTYAEGDPVYSTYVVRPTPPPELIEAYAAMRLALG